MPAVQRVPNTSEELVAFLKEIENLKNTTLLLGEIWFLVGVHWYRKMKDYLHGNGDQPGPIDNSDIIEQPSSSTSPRLKDGLQDELDYVLVPERAWNMLRDKFDLTPGQGTISKKVIDMGVFIKYKTVEVYPLELQLSVYSDEQNIVLVTFSRMATPTEVKKEARTRFQLGSAAQLRLYQKLENGVYRLVTDDKCHTPLSDLCFVNRQNVVIDVEENGQWHITQNEEVGAPSTDQTIELPLVGPSGSSGSSVASSGEAPSIGGRGMANFNNPEHCTPGLCGLTNLGNTCFMNSALKVVPRAFKLTDFFDQPNRYRNFALKVEDREFWVSREILSSYSSVFEAMLYGDFAESNQNIVPLPGKKAKDIEELLMCLIPTPVEVKEVDDDNLELLLAFSNEYQIANLRKRVEKYLITKMTFELATEDETLHCILRIASKWRMQDVLMMCAKKCASELSLSKLQSLFPDLRSEVIATVLMYVCAGTKQAGYVYPTKYKCHRHGPGTRATKCSTCGQEICPYCCCTSSKKTMEAADEDAIALLKRM